MNFNIKKSALIFTSIFLLLVLNSCTSSSTSPFLTSDSDSAIYYFKQGLEYERRINIPAATFNYLQALSFDPDFAMANLSMAGLQNDQRIANKYVKRAKKRYDDLSYAEQIQIQQFEEALKGNVSRQIDLLKKLYKTYPDIVEYSAIYGNFLFGQQEYEEAISIYLENIKKEPEFHQTYNQIGYSYRNIGDFQNAKKYLKMYIDKLPGEANPLDSYAELMVRLGDYETGLKYYQKAVQADSSFPSANFGVGTSLTYLGRTQEARESLKKYNEIVTNNNDRRNVVNSIAATYLWDDDLNNAMEYLDKAHFISDITGNLIAQINDLYTKHLVYYEYGQYENARMEIDHLIKTIDLSKLDSNNPTDSLLICFKNLAQGFKHYLEGELDQAEKIAQTYLSQNVIKNSPARKLNGQFLAGFVAMKKGDYLSAYKEFDKDFSTRPQDSYYRAICLEKLGRVDAALNVYNILINENDILTVQRALYIPKAKKELKRLNSQAD